MESTTDLATGHIVGLTIGKPLVRIGAVAAHGWNMIRKTSQKAGASSRKTKRSIVDGDAIGEAVAALDRLEPTSPKAKRIIAMLRSWLTDESGYDEETWPALSKSLDRERARVGARKLFDV